MFLLKAPSQKCCRDLQSGYIMIFVLMVFLIIAGICAALLELAFLEMKQGQYSFELKQAQQASHAGIACTLESVYESLNAQAQQEELPVIALEPGGPHPVSEASLCCYVLEPEGAVLQSYSEDSCIYGFTCTGKAPAGQCRMRVSCEYSFYEYYGEDGSGQKVFLGRVYKNRGRIVKCEILS